MDELPPLPDTANPFEVLGLPPTADELTIKRSYVALIKRYRPERAPGAFQRIREAYEEARQEARYRALYDELDDDDDDEDREAEDHDEVQTETASAGADSTGPGQRERALATSDSVGARATVFHGDATFEADDEDRASTELLAALANPDRADGAIVAIIDGRDSVDVLLDLPDSVRIELMEHPGLGWDRLRRANRYVATELLQTRVSALAFSGRLGQAADEFEAPELVSDSMGDPGLERLGVQLAAALVWDDAERAERLYRTYGSGDDDLSDAPRLYEDARALAPNWRRVCARVEVPEALRRFLQLYPLLDWPFDAILARALAQDVPAHPERYLAVFDQMALVGDGHLIVHHLELVSWLLEDDQLPADEADPLLDLVVQRDPTADEADAIDLLVQRIKEQDRGIDSGSGVGGTVFTIAIVGGIISARWLGWWALVVGGGVALLSIFLFLWLSDDDYDSYVRQELTTFIAWFGPTLLQLLYWIDRARGGGEIRRDYDQAVIGDLPLRALSDTVRMGHAADDALGPQT